MSHGRAVKGTPACQHENLTKSGNKMSLELFGDLSGPVVCDVFKGGLDAEEFVDFAWKKMYAHIKPYPGSYSVTIIDNANIE